MEMQPYLDCALEASEIARQLIKTAYEENAFKIEIKADATPVTEVDVAVEKAIYQHISAQFPEHGFYGEESGQKQMESDFIWLIDPIDGTKAFVRGRPLFSCQIALMVRGEIILGVSTAPCFNGGERIYAVKGQGAFLEGKRVSVSDIDTLSQAVFSSGNLKRLTQDPEKWARYGNLVGQVNSTRGFGDFLQYHFLATGKVDLIVESDVNILDIAALSIIVNEAGGKMTALDGSPIDLSVSTILAATPSLHAQALEILQF
ncbi:inositol-phosphate phosphatase [Ignatzschineria ureiclastica]|uniref:Nus factor SuhB n=1 Tax=Ignatzschineria ureiclastica TaxID=472582 RepID=A0A2U2AEN4_9GAMM|nr:inositol monophosphatase family protein [Ignatzschineria ureiclastica]PWD81125.1 inositol-phosphate phosphatase [Ignatzschineria ureiclastica]GGZ96433.1 histidinol-phosphatase [Ignatzschineria ureiclastica]